LEEHRVRLELFTKLTYSGCSANRVKYGRWWQPGDGSFASLGKRLSSLSKWQKRSLFILKAIFMKDIKSTPFRGRNNYQDGLS